MEKAAISTLREKGLKKGQIYFLLLARRSAPPRGKGFAVFHPTQRRCVGGVSG
ncbi:hypothetical protein [Stutzerimonas kunmingensis]|uniref:hypothetical protein n=1 Tax=Stutzerimonas kunmingensis TaxID=1211807 RepID=UPI00241FF909|nr:hypothetical protein [Stutzerimonas kunmingensis]